MALDLKPHSFTKLKSRGALEPTEKGATQLVKIVTDKDDKVRPRWKMQAFYFMNYRSRSSRSKRLRHSSTNSAPSSSS